MTQQVPLLPGVDQYALVDVDDSIIEVHGYAKQGAGFDCRAPSSEATSHCRWRHCRSR